jgi:hypothetical protein
MKPEGICVERMARYASGAVVLDYWASQIECNEERCSFRASDLIILSPWKAISYWIVLWTTRRPVRY